MFNKIFIVGISPSKPKKKNKNSDLFVVLNTNVIGTKRKKQDIVQRINERVIREIKSYVKHTYPSPNHKRLVSFSITFSYFSEH